MDPVQQTITTVPGGNCWPACIASITGIPLNEIPNFCAEYADTWLLEASKWLTARGWGVLEIQRNEGSDNWWVIAPGLFVIVSGKSPRGDWQHSIVGRCMEINRVEYVHDPHPAGGMLDGDPKYFTFLFPLKGRR